jgi:4'-phosphopantetheinyl transferase
MMLERNVYIDELQLISPGEIKKATLCFAFSLYELDNDRLIRHLHFQEREYFNTLIFPKKIRNYLLGRFVAKRAVADLTGEINLSNIMIQSGIFNQPIVICNKQNIQVSITHCGNCALALAFPEAYPLGVDLEKIDPGNSEVLEKQMSTVEKQQISVLPFSRAARATLIWTAKEALSKVLKTGLITPLEVFEIEKIECLKNNYIAGYYKSFPQYKVISFIVNGYSCSIAYPAVTKKHFAIDALKEGLGMYFFLNPDRPSV